jgi:hypothetical protein
MKFVIRLQTAGALPGRGAMGRPDPEARNKF